MIKTTFYPSNFVAAFNLLLLAVPIGFVLNYTKRGPVPIFVVNFIAILPCTRIVIYLSDQLILHTDDFVGVLISVTFRQISLQCRI